MKTQNQTRNPKRVKKGDEVTMDEVKIRTFDEITAEKVNWLWKPYIARGKITVIQGDPGNGKTALALAIAALVSRRKKMPTGNAPPFNKNVIYQSGEDCPNDTLKPRLIACGADCAQISDIEDDNLTPEKLEEAIIMTNTGLVVLDPLQAFLNGKQDISRTKDMRPILKELGNVAARTGAAIVIIGHMNKGEKSKGLYRGLGSIDIAAAARSVLLVGKKRDDNNTRFMTQIKNNLTTFGKSISFTINGRGKVRFIGECDVSESDLLSTTLPKKSQYEKARQVITTLLSTGDKRSNEIFDACYEAGCSRGTIDIVKKKMGIKSVRKIDDWYWTLNPDSDDDDDFEADKNAEDEVVFSDIDQLNAGNITPPAVTFPDELGALEPIVLEPKDSHDDAIPFPFLPQKQEIAVFSPPVMQTVFGEIVQFNGREFL